MINLTPVINAVIALLAAIIMTFAIPWIRRNMNEKEQAELLKWIDIAVAAAQQIYYQLDGADRKAYVVKLLREQGFDVDDSSVDAAIEAAVLKLHQEMEAAA